MAEPFVFDVASLALAAPECFLVALGVLLVCAEFLFPGQRLLLPALTMTGILTTLGLVLAGSAGIGFGGMFQVDGLARFFKVVCLVGTVFTVLLSQRNRQVEGMRHGEYYSLLIFAVTGMLVMASAADLIVVYLGLELMSLSIYCLVGLLKHDLRANEAAMKYFIMGAFASAVLLYGISLVYGLAGTTNLAAVSAQIAGRDAASEPLLLAGIGLLLVGLCFKVGAAPFHQWTPDVYEGAPTAITAFMSVAPKAASFAVLARVMLAGFLPIHEVWAVLVAGIALLTMTVGNVIALSQTSIKRMLAYSSIAHVGYALLGVLAGTEEGLSATMNYLFIYAFMNMGAFAVVILLAEKGQRRESLDDYRGLAASNPMLAALMLLFMFSLTGIPPTAGFIGKFSLLMAAVHAGYTGVVVAAVMLSAVSAYFYLRVVRYMYMDAPAGGKDVGLSAGVAVALGLAMVGVIGLGVAPSALVSLASQAGIGFP